MRGLLPSVAMSATAISRNSANAAAWGAGAVVGAVAAVVAASVAVSMVVGVVFAVAVRAIVSRSSPARGKAGVLEWSRPSPLLPLCRLGRRDEGRDVAHDDRHAGPYGV